MPDFVFQIEGDASKADRAADTVLDRLEDIKRQAAEASKAMSFDKLTQGFGRLADALRQEQQALARSTALHQQLTAASQPLARSFAGITEAIRHEQEVLERIEGPQKRYMADLQALDALHARGRITISQYADEVSKLNRSIENTPRAATPSAVTGPSAFAGVRQAAAVAGIGIGVREVGEMADQFGNLQNRLRYLAGGDMDRVNTMFAQLQNVARETRADLGATSEAFVRISLATKSLGLSQSETLSLTEHLNKAIALSGATSAEAAAGMIQLSQGLASGALRGDELRSVMEQLPAVADVIAQSMGVSRGELRKMGEEGKITAQVIVDAFRKAGPALDRDFGNTVPTLGQSLTVLKNDAMTLVGAFSEASGAGTLLGAGLHAVGTTVQGLTGAFQLIHRVLGDAGAAATAFGVALAVGLGPVAGIALAIEGAAYAGQKLHEWLYADEIATRKWNERLIEIDTAYSQQMRAVSAEADAIHNDIIAHQTLTETLVDTAQAVADGSANFQTLTDVMAAARDAAYEVGTAIDAGQKIILDENKKLTDAIQKVKDYGAAVSLLRAQLALFTKGGTTDVKKFLTAGDVKVVRDYQDAQEDVNDLTDRGGAVLSEIHKKERERRRGIEDLKDLLQREKITQAQYNEEVKKYLPHAHKAHQKKLDILKVVRDSAAAYDALFKAQKREREIFEDEAGLKEQAEGEREILQILNDIQTPAEKYAEKLERLNYLRDLGRLSAEQFARAQAKAFEESGLQKTDYLTKMWNDQIEAIHKADAERKKYVEGIVDVGLTLGDAAMKGSESFEEMGKRMLAQLAEVLVKALLVKAIMSAVGSGSGGGGDLGDAVLGAVTGHATGTQFMVGGRTGGDTNLVAFRARNDERVTVETQEDIRTGKYFGGRGGGVSIINQYQDDPRAIRRSLAGRAGDSIVYNSMQRLPRQQRRMR